MARFLGNTSTNQFHDLTRQRAQCQIPEILPEHRKEFVPDVVDQAIGEGYEPCFFCIGTVADLPVVGSGKIPASVADLSGEDLGGGEVLLRWTYSEDIAAQDIRFDVYSSADPLDPFRTLRADRHNGLSVVLTGFSGGGEIYFTVIARRGSQLSMPSRTLRLRVQPIVQPVVVSPGGTAAGQPASGLGFPFGIDTRGSVFAQGGDPLLRGKILQLILTAPGERVCLPDFGTRVRDMIFDPNNDILASTTEFMVTRALQKYMSDEIQVSQVQARTRDNELTVDIVYLRKADLRLEQVRIGIPTP
jgi:phage baseplate assembly protein W